MYDNLLKGVLNHVHEVCGFTTTKLVDLAPGKMVLETPCHDGYSNIYHKVNGGALLVLCDHAASGAAYSLGKHVVTLSSNFNFIRGVQADGRTMRIVAEVVHNGRTTIVVEVKIIDEDQKVCLRGTMTMFAVGEVDLNEAPPVAPGAFDANALPADNQYVKDHTIAD